MPPTRHLPPNNHPPETHPVEIIAADLPCLGCGYNLFTQPVESRCPECGSRVQWSLEHSALQWGPDHLRRLGQRAARLVATLLVLTLLAILGPVAIEFFSDVLIPRPHWNDPYWEIHQFYRSLSWACLWLIITALAVVHFVLVWRWTRPRPLQRFHAPEGFMRCGALALLAATALCAVTLCCDTLHFTGFEGLLDDHSDLLHFLFKTVLIIEPVLMFLVALYPWGAAAWINDIYHRTGPTTPRTFTRWSLRLFSLGIVLLAVLLASILIIENSQRRLSLTGEIYLLAVALSAAATLLLGGIASIIALSIFSRRMKSLAPSAPHSPDDLTVIECRPDPLPGPSALA